MGKKFAGLAAMGFGERGGVGGRFGAEVDGASVRGDLDGEAGGGMDLAGGADGEEDRAAVEFAGDLVEVERDFAEPADVRADLPAAGAARNGGTRP